MFEVASGTLITMPVPLRDPLNEKRVEVTPLETDVERRIDVRRSSRPKFILFMTMEFSQVSKDQTKDIGALI
ncbi:hypothetical protein pdam_00008546 [Pocillopora damicornis]|uniref:Uncharacterized protein n=1 Tax=Pocillopora damicornis TaxID=46731 RepID=A0A3M6U2J4_POCDA|nr:hypothetical protein pdam_00008546 [Pocillopora damicornis]